LPPPPPPPRPLSLWADAADAVQGRTAADYDYKPGDKQAAKSLADEL
jgi:hypothetical protein